MGHNIELFILFINWPIIMHIAFLVSLQFAVRVCAVSMEYYYVDFYDEIGNNEDQDCFLMCRVGFSLGDKV